MLPDSRIIEALQLTQYGKLGEATSLLRNMLGGKGVNSTFTRDSFSTIDHEKLPKAFNIGEQSHTQWGMPDVFNGLNIKQATNPLRENLVSETGQFLSKSFSNAAGTRDYKLYVPKSYIDAAMPLIIMLHGCTQSPDDFAAGTQMNKLAEEKGFLVAYPEQSALANKSKCWNWFKSGDQQHGRGEPSLIAGITTQIIKDYRVDPTRVYVAGLSAGGAAAAIMGETYPALYAAVGVHSGLAYGAANDLPTAMTAMKRGSSGALRNPKLPTIVFHGDRDKTVNLKNGEQILGADISYVMRHTEDGKSTGGLAYRRILYPSENGKISHEKWIVYGAGHAWSGGSAAGSYTEPKGPDASREMVRFFLSQNLKL